MTTTEQGSRLFGAINEFVIAVPNNVLEIFRLSYQILTKGRINAEEELVGPLAFSISCMLFGMLFVILEFCIRHIRHRSIMRIPYGQNFKIGLFLTVPITAGIVGALGFFLDLLQPSRAAAITVGIAWPAFLSAFFNTPEGGPADEDPDKSAEDL